MAMINDATIGFDPEAVELMTRFIEAVDKLNSFHTVADIQRIGVHPGEALVVRIPSNTCREDRDRVVAAFKFALPGVPVLVVNADMIDLQVIAQEALDDG